MPGSPALRPRLEVCPYRAVRIPVTVKVPSMPVVLGSLIGLIGLFLILYQGDSASEADTYVNLGGRKVDGDFVGIPLLVITFVVIALSLRSPRKSGIP
jgi:ribose/xylose/arabinose/galactoside ABC-type transport system permease subunit